MTTRRSRLHIRPNIGRGAKETGNDVPAKKMPIITGKPSPRKEAKENSSLSTRSEANNVIEQVFEELACDKASTEHSVNNKELTGIGNVGQNEECSPLTDAHSCLSVSFNEVNAVTQKSTLISENYTALLNANRKCTVVLDRTIVKASKHAEKTDGDFINIPSENCSPIKNTVVKLSHEKEQKCEEKVQPELIQQIVCESGLKNNHSSDLLPGNKEKNIVQSKEKVLLQQDSSTNPTGKSQFPVEDDLFVKPISQNLTTCLPEKKSSNKTQSSEETKRRNRFSKRPPERGTMTMMDLIHYNPPNNPMSHERKTDGDMTEADENVLQIGENEEIENTSNLKDGICLEESSLETETEELPGPRVMIGPNGDITIDEDSLVIRRTDPEQNASKQIVHEVAECTYNSFRKPRPKHYWTDKETARFYKALSIVGTDFSLMLNLFPKRNRQELKNKFKREERLNRHLVDRAIKDPQQFDLSAFDDDNNEISEDERRNGFKHTKRCSNRKKSKRRKYVKGKGSFKDDTVSDDDASIEERISSKPNENTGIRKSTRKRKETSKEIITYSTAQTAKRRPSKPRVPKPKKKVENLPMECEYESVEIQEIPNENLEVVSEDQSIIVCHSPLASEVAHRSDLHINVRETTQDMRITNNSNELKQNEQQDANIVIQPDTQLQETNIETPPITNNVLQAINSSQSNLTPGQLVLVAGKTNNSNEQVVHVYVVS